MRDVIYERALTMHAFHDRNPFFAHASCELGQDNAHVLLGAVSAHCEPKVGSYVGKIKAGIET